MIQKCTLVFLAVFGLAAATDVKQCPGHSIDAEVLKELVQLAPCNKPPCKLKKGTDQNISIIFTPDEDIPDITNHVTANVFGADLPFPGVDGTSICDKIFTESGEKAACPVTKGNKYVYKDQFPIFSFYPNLSTKVHWALRIGKEDITCFEVPVKIV